MSATAQRSKTIAAPKADIWTILSDFASISSWAPNVDHSCLMSEQFEGIGMVRRIQTGSLTVLETVTGWEPPAILSYSISGLPPVIKFAGNRWTLESTSDGTRVTLSTTVEAGLRPPQQAVARIAARRLAGESDKMLSGLATRLARTSVS